PSANLASRRRSWSSRRPTACRRCPTRSGTSRPRNAPAHNRRGREWLPRKRLRAGRQRKPIVSWPSSHLPRTTVLCGRRQIAEARQILFLLLVTRRQLEQPRRGAAENVVLGFFRQERQVPDRRRQVEIPVRIVRRIKELGLGIHHAERALHRLVILNLHRLR